MKISICFLFVLFFGQASFAQKKEIYIKISPLDCISCWPVAVELLNTYPEMKLLTDQTTYVSVQTFLRSSEIDIGVERVVNDPKKYNLITQCPMGNELLILEGKKVQFRSPLRSGDPYEIARNAYAIYKAGITEKIKIPVDATHWSPTMISINPLLSGFLITDLAKRAVQVIDKNFGLLYQIDLSKYSSKFFIEQLLDKNYLDKYPDATGKIPAPTYLPAQITEDGKIIVFGSFYYPLEGKDPRDTTKSIVGLATKSFFSIYEKETLLKSYTFNIFTKDSLSGVTMRTVNKYKGNQFVFDFFQEVGKVNTKTDQAAFGIFDLKDSLAPFIMPLETIKRPEKYLAFFAPNAYVRGGYVMFPHLRPCLLDENGKNIRLADTENNELFSKNFTLVDFYVYKQKLYMLHQSEETIYFSLHELANGKMLHLEVLPTEKKGVKISQFLFQPFFDRYGAVVFAYNPANEYFKRYFPKK